MKRLIPNILALLVLAVLMFSCGKRKALDKGLWALEIDYTSSSPLDSVWYLYTFGTHSVSIDTLERASVEGRITFERVFERDTLDLCLLYDGSGDILLPIFPDPGYQFSTLKLDKKNPKIKAEGMRYAEDLTKWLSFLRGEALPDSIRQDSLHTFLTSMLRHKAGAMIFTHYNLSGDTSEIARRARGIGQNLILEDRELINVIGVSSNRLSYLDPYNRHRSVGTTLPIEIKDKKGTSLLKVSTFAKKKGVALYQFTTLYKGDSLSTAIATKVIKKMDSLKIPLLTTLVETDKLPKEWKSHPIGQVAKTPSYFLVDSLGEASEFATQRRINRLPTYLLVDTLGMIKEQWHEADSVFAHFAKEQKK